MSEWIDKITTLILEYVSKDELLTELTSRTELTERDVANLLRDRFGFEVESEKINPVVTPTWWKIRNEGDHVAMDMLSPWDTVGATMRPKNTLEIAEQLLRHAKQMGTLRCVDNETPIPEPLPNGFRWIIDPGHSDSEPGARSDNEKVKEEVLNRAQAEYLKRRIANVTIVDPDVDHLEAIGARAGEGDGFISLHHNSFDGTGDPGVEVWVHTNAGEESVRLAQLLVDSIAAELKCLNRGVKRGSLWVLRAAEDNSYGPCVLVESYFVNPYTDPVAAEGRSLRAAEAIARVLDQWK